MSVRRSPGIDTTLQCPGGPRKVEGSCPPVMRVRRDGTSIRWNAYELEDVVDHVVRIPRTIDMLTPILASVPLQLRGPLVRLGARDQVLLVTLHPLVSDAESLGVFAHEPGVTVNTWSP